MIEENYKYFFENCEKKNQDIIKAFETDIQEGMNVNDLSEKYNLTVSDSSFPSLIRTKILIDSNFLITLSENLKIEITQKSNFKNYNYMFLITMSKDVDFKSYSTEISLCKKSPSFKINFTSDLDFFICIKEKKGSIYIPYGHNSLKIELNSKKTIQNSKYYVLDDVNLLELILKNLKEPETLKDYLLLITDHNIDSDDFLSTIYENSQKIKNLNISLKMHTTKF